MPGGWRAGGGGWTGGRGGEHQARTWTSPGRRSAQATRGWAAPGYLPPAPGAASPEPPSSPASQRSPALRFRRAPPPLSPSTPRARGRVPWSGQLCAGHVRAGGGVPRTMCTRERAELTPHPTPRVCAQRGAHQARRSCGRCRRRPESACAPSPVDMQRRWVHSEAARRARRARQARQARRARTRGPAHAHAYHKLRARRGRVVAQHGEEEGRNCRIASKVVGDMILVDRVLALAGARAQHRAGGPASPLPHSSPGPTSLETLTTESK